MPRSINSHAKKPRSEQQLNSSTRQEKPSLKRLKDWKKGFQEQQMKEEEALFRSE